jgi:hypothetical protein
MNPFMLYIINVNCMFMKYINFYREKMESISSEMEKISELVTEVLCSNSKKGRASALNLSKPPSVLCLTKFHVNQSYLTWNELGDAEQPMSYALCLHASPQDQEFRLCSREGSNFFKTPAGSALVSVGKQLQVIFFFSFFMKERQYMPVPFIQAGVTYKETIPGNYSNN